jgi:hypothetical protein
LVDALLIPAFVMWWFYKQPDHGGTAGAVAAVFMTWWALKRGWRAVFEFDEYNWMVVKIATILAIVVGIHLVMKHWISVAQLV